MVFVSTWSRPILLILWNYFSPLLSLPHFVRSSFFLDCINNSIIISWSWIIITNLIRRLAPYWIFNSIFAKMIVSLIPSWSWSFFLIFRNYIISLVRSSHLVRYYPIFSRADISFVVTRSWVWITHKVVFLPSYWYTWSCTNGGLSLISTWAWSILFFFRNTSVSSCLRHLVSNHSVFCQCIIRVIATWSWAHRVIKIHFLSLHGELRRI